MTTINYHEELPVAPLRIIALNNCRELGEKVNELIIQRRKKALAERGTDLGNSSLNMQDYDCEDYLVPYDCPRFGTGEGRGTINQSVRGTDLFIIADTVNYSELFSIHGDLSRMSPDDHFMDLKRVIMACGGSPRRITVIMPYLYEGRQNVRLTNESLDCAQALQELTRMGVETIITFDAHDSRVQNAIPIHGFDNFYTSYQFISEIFRQNPDMAVDNDHLMIVSPDEGGMGRAVYYASLLGVNMGTFYRRKDYSVTIEGQHPVVSVEFLGNDPSGKNILLLDDMIASGHTMMEVSAELKRRGAAKVIVCATFGLFSDGLTEIDEAFEKGVFDNIYTTNLVYCPPELKSKPYYINVDLSAYISLIIDTLNHDTSVNNILDATKRIQDLVANR
jgi:ribose-phosphate pyrophosphokinase